MKFTVKYLFMVFILAAAFIMSGCSKDKAAVKAGTQILVDGAGRKVELSLPVKRVVVANSHNVELINSIGSAIEKVVGVDANIYCDPIAYKGRFKEHQLIGENQRFLNYEKIINLAPDVLLISGNGHWQEAEKQLAPFGIKVFVLNAYYTGNFRHNCEIVGKIFGEEKAAAEFAGYFEDKLAYVKRQLQNVPKRRVYFEYRNQNVSVTPGRPYYKMVEYSGVQNIFDDADSPYIDGEAIIKRNPEYVVKASESQVRSRYTPPSEEDFKERKARLLSRPGWEELDAVKNDKILLLSHYAFGGACEITGSLYMAKFVYPEYLPELHPEQIFKEWVEKYQRLPYVAGHTYPRFTFDD